MAIERKRTSKRAASKRRSHPPAAQRRRRRAADVPHPSWIAAQHVLNRPSANITEQQDDEVSALLDLYAWIIQRQEGFHLRIAQYKHYATRAAQGLKPTDEAWEPSDPIARAEWRRSRDEDFWLAMAGDVEKSMGYFRRDLHRYTKGRSGPPLALKKRWALADVPDGHKERAIFVATELLLRYRDEDPQGRLLRHPMKLTPGDADYRAKHAFFEAESMLDNARAAIDGKFPAPEQRAAMRQSLRESMQPGDRHRILDEMLRKGGPTGTGREREVQAVVAHLLGVSLSSVLQIHNALKHRPLTLVVNNDVS